MTVPAGMVWVSNDTLEGAWVVEEIGDASKLQFAYPDQFKLVPKALGDAVVAAYEAYAAACSAVDDYVAPTVTT
jgi:hypothetical protein